MKLVTFRVHDDPAGAPPRLGAVREDGTVVDFSSVFGWGASPPAPPGDRGVGSAGLAAAADGRLAGLTMVDLIARAGELLPVARALLAQSPEGSLRAGADVRLLAPIPRPVSMRDGYAFRQHVETARRNRGVPMIPEFDLFPVFYFTNHLSVIGPGELRVGRERLQKLDFELECFCVIGKEVTNPTLEEADEAIFGYGVMNDLSARALQMEEMKLNLGPAKGKDFATALGPWLVTKDELAARISPSPKGNVLAARMTAEVNGVRVSDGNVAQMDWTFAQIVQRAADGVTLVPGEVIGSGTVGTGCFLELNGSKITHDQWLKPGDVVSLAIEGMGELTHTIVEDASK